jgi:hypothetical protein
MEIIVVELAALLIIWAVAVAVVEAVVLAVPVVELEVMGCLVLVVNSPLDGIRNI